MFILLMFILAYRYHRANANGVRQASIQNLETVAWRTGELRGQMGNGKPAALWPHGTRAQDEHKQNDWRRGWFHSSNRGHETHRQEESRI